MLASMYPYIYVSKTKHVCHICHFSRQKGLPYSDSYHNATSPFDLIHLDVWKPYRVTTLHQHKYFLTIVDDFSRHIWIVFLKHKSEVKHHLQGFIKLVQTQFNKTIKIVRSDNGTKFLLHNLYHEYGIQRQTSCGQTPQQNGQVERQH